ncbi:uncharacterized protein LOC111716010 isoform X2 [Eurytemora carolleeae]|uniref:uncharacterized protein LOC111716010 isoform X2 n=1 Tax=Eurytemora carolleeae TaxID=1294199 RepID=UPI000C78FFD4|nr:uncharacterized protein LOC111716010 isoform X2 [Eurytemora carolleeae]|eukprot:XP_023347195.1 uncharacterized protein LOC111716010 isoform X2 [Eurytemora affinis]
MKHNLIIQLVGLIFLLILFYLTFPKQITNMNGFGRSFYDIEKCTCALPQSKIDAVGGWIYNEATIRNHHVSFDNGAGKEILRIVLKNTPKTEGVKPKIGDIGAGVGQFGEWLKKTGSSSVDWYGFDGGSNVNSFCGKNVSLVNQEVYTVPKVCFLDASLPVKLEDFYLLGAPFDWVMSVEVGEHIPAEYTKTYIDNLIRLSKYGIILSWAVVGQGGHGHVNNMDNQDVIKMMTDRSMVYLPQETATVRSRVQNLSWLKNTIMIFSKVDGMDAAPEP